MAALRRPRRHLAGLLAAICLLAGACVSEPELPRGKPDPLAGAGQGVCGLLTIDEIEVALNTPLTGQQPRAGSTVPHGTEDTPSSAPAELPAPDAASGESRGGGHRDSRATRPVVSGMQMCQIGSTAAGAAWGRLDDPPGDETVQELFDRYTGWHEDHVERVQVEGHDAIWDPPLGTLVVLTEDEILAIRVVDGQGTSEMAPIEDLAVRALTRLR